MAKTENESNSQKITSEQMYESLYIQYKMFKNGHLTEQKARELFAKSVKLLVIDQYPKATNLLMYAYNFGIGVEQDYNKAFKLACYNFVQYPNKSSIEFLLNAYVKLDYDSTNVSVDDVVCLAKVFGVHKKTLVKLNELRNPTIPPFDELSGKWTMKDAILKFTTIETESKDVLVPSSDEKMTTEELDAFISDLISDAYYKKIDEGLKSKVVLSPKAIKKVLDHRPKPKRYKTQDGAIRRKSYVEKDPEQDNYENQEVYKFLSKYVKGQKEALIAITSNILNTQNGISNENGPRAKYFFYGYTGTGKTELAKVMAKMLKQPFTVVPMENYAGSDGSSKLIGSAQGYRDSEMGGALTNKIKENPKQVILFDEIEKASPDVIKNLLGLLDRGEIEDGLGNKYDAKQTTIIFTSNVGVQQVVEQGLKDGTEEEKMAFEKELRSAFPPEFLGRLPNKVLFRRLPRDVMEELLKGEIRSINKRLKNGNMISLTDDAIDAVLNEPVIERENVRGLKNVVTNKILRKVSPRMACTSEHEFEVYYDEGEYQYNEYVLEKCPAKPAKEEGLTR